MAKLQQASSELLSPDGAKRPKIFDKRSNIADVSSDQQTKKSFINQELVETYGYDYTYDYDAFSNWLTFSGRGLKALEQYIAEECGKLKEQGLPILSSILKISNDSFRDIALAVCDNYGYAQTVNLVLIPDSESILPKIDIHGRPLSPERMGKVLEVKLGTLGSSDLHSAEAASAREQHSGKANSEKLARYMATGNPAHRIYKVKTVAHGLTAPFSRKEATIALLHWGYGIASPRFVGGIGNRVDRHLIIDLPEQV